MQPLTVHGSSAANQTALPLRFVAFLRQRAGGGLEQAQQEFKSAALGRHGKPTPFVQVTPGRMSRIFKRKRPGCAQERCRARERKYYRGGVYDHDASATYG